MYRGVDNALVARIVVNVDCDAAQGRDFGGEFVEAGVVLSAFESAVACYAVGYLGVGMQRVWESAYCSRS
jgi:hypothetical protein